ncbi:Hypothetical protein A7982_06483 [Minicystis rosea]|nr:Hypothetical protein A7982_06483 [Minicystis rosea]
MIDEALDDLPLRPEREDTHRDPLELEGRDRLHGQVEAAGVAEAGLRGSGAHSPTKGRAIVRPCQARRSRGARPIFATPQLCRNFLRGECSAENHDSTEPAGRLRPRIGARAPTRDVAARR